MRDNSKFLKGLEELGIELSQVQLDQFERYYDLLIKWNDVMNLTAITEYDEVITKHFLDSLSIVKIKTERNNAKGGKNVSCETSDKQHDSGEKSERALQLSKNIHPKPENVSCETLDKQHYHGEESESTLQLSEDIHLKSKNVSCETLDKQHFFGEESESTLQHSKDIHPKSENVSCETLGKQHSLGKVSENALQLSEDIPQKPKNVSHETSSYAFAGNQAVSTPGSSIKLLDLGTGAGFPGIPLKIAFPELDVTLMDSLNKRINFLNEVIHALSLKNISAIHGRAEEFGRKEDFREQFDCCVSRAVARLVSLSEYCLPFVRKGGFFIPYKSVKSEEELEEAKYAIGQLGGKYLGKTSFMLPGSDAERTLFLIKKCRETPKKYPRAGGKPVNKPLLQNHEANPKEK